VELFDGRHSVREREESESDSCMEANLVRSTLHNEPRKWQRGERGGEMKGDDKTRESERVCGEREKESAEGEYGVVEY
jgi:hypothetical protein